MSWTDSRIDCERSLRTGERQRRPAAAPETAGSSARIASTISTVFAAGLALESRGRSRACRCTSWPSCRSRRRRRRARRRRGAPAGRCGRRRSSGRNAGGVRSAGRRLRRRTSGRARRACRSGRFDVAAAMADATSSMPMPRAASCARIEVDRAPRTSARRRSAPAPRPSRVEMRCATSISAYSLISRQRQRRRGQRQEQDREVGRIDLLERGRRRHVRRQRRAASRDGGLHVLRGRVDVAIELELQRDRRAAERACSS